MRSDVADVVRAAVDAELIEARRRRGGEPPRVLDVGGGTGVLAVPLAAAGCVVTVVEPNPNALATLHRRAEEAAVAERINAVPGDSDVLAELVPAGSVDLALAHGVLEVVDDPKNTVAAMVATLATGGVLSVVVANRHAALLQRVVAGHLADAARLLADPAGALPGEVLLRRYDTESLRQLLLDAGLSIERIQGSAVLTELVTGQVLGADPFAGEQLFELERRVAAVPPLRDIATRLHALARRSA